MIPMIIYHANCDDGFGAAYAAWNKYSCNAQYVPASYGDTPPNVKGRVVYILDFSYKREVLEKMAEEAKCITVLDHHKTSMEDLKPLLDSGVVDGVFDMNRSGAMLAWEKFNPRVPVPALIHHIQDRDLWSFKFKDTRKVTAALRSYPQDFRVWSEFMDSRGVAKLRNEGESIERFYNAKVKDILKNEYRVSFGIYSDVPIVNCPAFMASDVCGELAKGKPFAISYSQSADGTLVSLRSDKNGVDVSKLAGLFGGGGHKHASGFRIDKEYAYPWAVIG